MGGTRRPYTGPEPYIFISYARKDAGTVYPLLDALTDAGYRYWYDKDGIPPGKEWADVIAEKITKSAAVLAFHSEESKKSKYCGKEVKYAISEDRHVVLVYVDDAELEKSLKLLLGSIQALKLSDSDRKNPKAFAARLGEYGVFAPCREPVWNRIGQIHKIGQIQWKLDAAGVLTIAKNANLPEWYRGNVCIPGYQQDPVNGGSTAPWMPYREKICAVVIQNDIDTIGDCAFRDCTSLTAVTIPDSVTQINRASFYGCTSLTAVTIPDSVTQIGKIAFGDCTSLTAVTIPDSMTETGESAFYWCTSLTAVTIPNSVTEISRQAFIGCTSLTAVTIPDSVTKIRDGAFCACTSLTAVTIPDSVTKIGGWAFHDCLNLKRVEIPSGANVGPIAFDPHTEVIRRRGPK